MIRMPVRRLATAVATLLAAGGAVALAVPTANADTLNCLAPLTAIQTLNNEAVQYDQNGNTSAAAAEDAGTAYYMQIARPNCYYNPSVPYTAYQDAISSFTYVNAAQSANNAGNASAALQDGQTAATYLNAAITILEHAGP